MFKKVLIANRGAIAARIVRTLKKMNVQSVVVYTTADQDNTYVAEADEAIFIGDGPAKESYLNADLILEKARAVGAEAIHPGYGFLSENAAFARDCMASGIAFVGPKPEQIEQFGLKHSARQLAKEAQVPLLPGTHLIEDLEEALASSTRIGYPVILKSTAGGGGIGMKVCEDEQALREAFEAVTHLAEKNFNNGGVFVEKYIASARHVEVQVFGTETEIVALGERDCSLQRRNQKVVEETPAHLLNEAVREKMLEASIRLAKLVGYRSAGTVEYLYDPTSDQFYFLEVNTRLQVEHGVTEEVTGVDLVEWMIKEAAGELANLSTLVSSPQGHSMQVRIYAEDCFNQFQPSVGTIDDIVWPAGVRIETGIQKGGTISTYYDPMVAKVIVHADTREDAITRLQQALSEMRVYGVTTNLQYLEQVLMEESVRSGAVYTKLLESFLPEEASIEVLDGGIQTTVQDFPGRTGHWNVGVPPCGPMDSYAFRIGNQLLGNAVDAPGLELTLRGGGYRFRAPMTICLTGADMQATLDGVPVARYETIQVAAQQVLSLKEAEEGMRSYLLVAGGLDMPKYLGSASTFTLGGFGGHNGRPLHTGDVLRVNAAEPVVPRALQVEAQQHYTHEWEIGVIAGPHCTKEYLEAAYLEELTATNFEVHFNSSRTGVRLIGPTPKWTRKDGGEAGLHPSNIHDNAYAIGTLDLTGDMPILLGPDGPSLGGFVCPVTTASAEFWKIGQLHAGDTVRFKLLSVDEANALRKNQEQFLEELTVTSFEEMNDVGYMEQADPETAILFRSEKGRFPMVIRADGDENLLVEYGDMVLDLLLRFQAHLLMEAIKERTDIPVIDLTPGIRSLQVHIDSTKMTLMELCRIIDELNQALPVLEEVEVPSRIVHLPLSWDDPSTQLAIERYQKNVRPDAPWCPSNIEFIRRMNGLGAIDDVRRIVFDANYLVMGLGDVYLGAPVATPLDPRHRLVTTKYNPARTWTPENAVGIGGAYMCVYGMEGPGGYQFVGRTVQMWNRLRATKSFTEGKPWLLRFFDQIRFYPVAEEELGIKRQQFLRGQFEVKIEETTFKLRDYIRFLEEVKVETQSFKQTQQQAFDTERERWRDLGLDEYVAEHHEAVNVDSDVPENSEAIRCTLPGSIWKVLVEAGMYVRKGEVLLVEESMKMEFPQVAPFDGIVKQIYVSPGDEVQANQLMVALEPIEVEVKDDESIIIYQ
ncbi:urea carboxylase [Peribacillus sp. NPDC046944]|uniref:urea carboxylase n=1 Tax=unclassified Peribacillus TaxID=2675266 RepID=UPI003D028164